MKVLNLKAVFLTKIYNLSFLGLGNRPFILEFARSGRRDVKDKGPLVPA
jgi:hypothetical protein